MREPTLGVDQAVVQVGRVRRIVEDQHLAGVLVDLRVRGDAVRRELAREGFLSQIVQGERIERVQFATQEEARECATAMHYDIRAGGILGVGFRA